MCARKLNLPPFSWGCIDRSPNGKSFAQGCSNSTVTSEEGAITKAARLATSLIRRSSPLREEMGSLDRSDGRKRPQVQNGTYCVPGSDTPLAYPEVWSIQTDGFLWIQKPSSVGMKGSMLVMLRCWRRYFQKGCVFPGEHYSSVKAHICQSYKLGFNNTSFILYERE